jgi:LAO/AO transport system kinase
MSAQPDGAAIVAALAAGSARTCARLITAVERDDPAVIPVLQALYRAGGRAKTIGVTGPPGAGKSSLVNQLVGELRRRGRTVAVLAVDPSSPFSGGAVLGDRLRMMQHACDDGVFIRSMASRGQLGGLARAAGDALTVLDAMPWDHVIVETVGVGQNETDVMRIADMVVLVQTPMGGDDVQAAKAGITEIGDIYVVNKADLGDAGRTVHYLQDMIALGRRLRPDNSWTPPVVKTEALGGAGVSELVDHIDRRFADLAENANEARMRGRRRVEHRTSEILRDMVGRRLRKHDDRFLDARIDGVLRREQDPYALASAMLEAGAQRDLSFT